MNKNCDKKGLSGEIGCYQFMPKTWKDDSKKYLGYEARPSFINQQYVTAHKVQVWLDKGYATYQIGLLYNGGEVKEKKGVNKYGVKYDSGAYAKKLVINLANIAEANETR